MFWGNFNSKFVSQKTVHIIRTLVKTVLQFEESEQKCRDYHKSESTKTSKLQQAQNTSKKYQFNGKPKTQCAENGLNKKG